MRDGAGIAIDVLPIRAANFRPHRQTRYFAASTSAAVQPLAD
jgi:hypothetical protein